MSEHDAYLADALALAAKLRSRHGEFVDGLQVTPTDHDAIDGAMYIWEMVDGIKRLSAVKLRAKLLIACLERAIKAGPLSRFPIPERDLLGALREAVVAAEYFR